MLDERKNVFHVSTSSEIDVEKIQQSLALHKVVLLKNPKYAIDDFREISALFGTHFQSYQGGAFQRNMVQKDKTLLTVTGKMEMKMFIPMHGEMHYKKIKPSLLFFFCETPPVFKGETTICDANQFYNELSEYARQFFLNEDIQYIRDYPREKWQQVFQTDRLDSVAGFFTDNGLQWKVDNNDNLTTTYTCSAINKEDVDFCFINNILPVSFQEHHQMKGSIIRMKSGSPIPSEIFRDIWKKSVYLQHKVVWEKGDVLIIDNKKAMHGRTRICDNQRNILVRMSERIMA